MTPMVDLAFLLLTFFILTTTFFKPHLMEIVMPDPAGSPTPVNERNVLNLVAGEDRKLYWWIANDPTPRETNYSRDGLRRVLLERMASHPRTIVLIKPMASSKFVDVVDILDEMNITGTARFAIVDPTREDLRLIEGD